ncbi:hypothetical protein B4113_2989 [Geobacillus sp. B4113_201601]|nr:hypothetical protein B4113_2989 [Geobacillus sp. B4113_201601]
MAPREKSHAQPFGYRASPDRSGETATFTHSIANQGKQQFFTNPLEGW